MCIKQIIPDDQTRSTVLALATARHLPVRQDGAWVEFCDVKDSELVQGCLRQRGFRHPVWTPGAKRGSFPAQNPLKNLNRRDDINAKGIRQRVTELPHRRKPAVSGPSEWADWLDPAASEADLQALLRPPPFNLMKAAIRGQKDFSLD
jgi:hypothetical protein